MSVQTSLSDEPDTYVLVAPTTSTVGPDCYHVETVGRVPLCNSTGGHGADYRRELLSVAVADGGSLCSTCRARLEKNGRDTDAYESS